MLHVLCINPYAFKKNAEVKVTGAFSGARSLISP